MEIEDEDKLDFDPLDCTKVGCNGFLKPILPVNCHGVGGCACMPFAIT